MITQKELFSVCFGGEVSDVADHEPKLADILARLNLVRLEYGLPLHPSCFYRSVGWDRAKGRSGKSQHCLLKACDFHDPAGDFARWCMGHTEVLERVGLWLEHPKYTPGWCHLDMKPRKNRVFVPY